MRYAVDWIEAAHARDEHLGVWERNLALPVTARRRFDWLYRDNPAGPGRMAVLRAGSGDQATIVGTAGYALRAFEVGGDARHAAVLADLAVDRAHRTAMPALMLLRAVRTNVLAGQDAVYGFPNAQADPLVRKLGYRLLGETRRFVLVLRHGRHVGEPLRDKLGDAWGARATPLAGIALDVLRRALVAGRAAQAAMAHRLRFVTEVEVDERFDRLWQTARRDYAVVGVRDAAFVRWRFLGRPEGPMEIAVLQARKSDALLGYAAIARDRAVAHVRDLFAPRAALAPLLRLLCGALVARGLESVSMRFCGAPWLAEALATLGFRERADRRSVIIDRGPGLGDSTDRIFDAAAWHLTDADEDA